MEPGGKRDLDALINSKIEESLSEVQAKNDNKNPGTSEEPGDRKEIFFQAVQKGDIDGVKKMLDQGIDPDEKNVFDATALMLAAHNGHTAIVKELLARGANVDTKSDDGVTALMAAAYEGHLEIVKELLDHGADANAQSNSGLTALSVARERNHTAIVNLLTSIKR